MRPDLLIAAAMMTYAASPATSEPLTSVAVFPFELEDKSAGAGIIAPDARDIRYLAETTDEAKRHVAASGRYQLVDTSAVDLGTVAKYGIRNCDRCEAGVARKLGADQAMLGVVTRVNRTEFTLFIRVIDARTGQIVSADFTGLRMGANYAWPRGAKSLLGKRLAAQAPQAPASKP